MSSAAADRDPSLVTAGSGQVVEATMTPTYNANSAPQGAATVLSRDFIDRVYAALTAADSKSPSRSSRTLTVADFGCSGARNSLPVLDALLAHHPDVEQVQLIMNDLPTNNWTAVHSSVTEHFRAHPLWQPPSLLLSTAGFYNRATLDASIDIAFTATALHWLQRKPIDIANAYSYTSPRCTDAERATFAAAAAVDYSLFLQLRSRELRVGSLLFLLNITRDPQTGKTHVDEVYEMLWECAQGCGLRPAELLAYTDSSFVRDINTQVDPATLRAAGFECVQHEFVYVESPLVRQYLLVDGDADDVAARARAESEFASAQSAFYRSWTEHTLRAALAVGSDGRSPVECDALVDAFYARLTDVIRRECDFWRRNPCRFYVFAALRKVADVE